MPHLFRFSAARVPFLLLALEACAFGSNTVVNLSHYDAMRPDFETMRAQGIVGVIHEASYPAFVQDAKYAGRQQAAARAGLLWGAYHFANNSNPVRQADHLLGVVSSSWRRADPDSRPNEVLLVLDFEPNRHYPGGTMRVEQAVAFVERIRERTGGYPGLYGGENRLRQVLNSRKVTEAQRRVLRRCWLWVANYHSKPRSVLPWSHWTMWQYTGDGVCDLPRASFPKNIANIRNAERNMFRGSAAELRAFWESHGWRPGE
ncbi:MAG: glycoside hydrolase family 25 protein [Chthoniobacterales bacterium]|nr:glycoside hydrolase family 25 protein [Chthoniobacterales bacterium]